MLFSFCSRPQLYVPPGDLYTSFEKLFIPFDSITWGLIGVTFTIAVVFINIINHLPKRIKRYFYGKTKQAPILNIFRIFFGIGQTKLPDKHFGRLILISYIFWCLVIRTVYQGILFILTTNAVTKPMIKSLDELRHKNFSLYVPNNTNLLLTETLEDLLR